MTAHLVVQHAAAAAARAAVVVGPDDPRFYDDQKVDDLNSGLRLQDVKSAAALVLGAVPAFRDGAFELKLDGSFRDNEPLTATLTAGYRCSVRWLNAVCGGGELRSLTATASLPYQGASYVFGDVNAP
jgi:hypothetical protein